jgi:hypothetical protein
MSTLSFFRLTILCLGVCCAFSRTQALRGGAVLEAGGLNSALLGHSEGLLGKDLKKVIFVAVSRKTLCESARGCPWDAAVGATRVKKMVANWKAELTAAWATIPTVTQADNKVLKVITWPEWTWRASLDSNPLSAAEARRITRAIGQHLSSVAAYAASTWIIPGTIYWGVRAVPRSTANRNAANLYGAPTCGGALSTVCGTDAGHPTVPFDSVYSRIKRFHA